MRICIVGARERDTADDARFVQELMDAVKERTPNVIFVTMMTHMGVGRFVRDASRRVDGQGRKRFHLVDASVHTYAQFLSRSDLADIYLARNATPFELSDMLYYLPNEERRGPLENLLQRFIDAGRPYKICMPGDEVEVL